METEWDLKQGKWNKTVGTVLLKKVLQLNIFKDLSCQVFVIVISFLVVYNVFQPSTLT
jgi:hypothetical protein